MLSLHRHSLGQDGLPLDMHIALHSIAELQRVQFQQVPAWSIVIKLIHWVSCADTSEENTDSGKRRRRRFSSEADGEDGSGTDSAEGVDAPSEEPGIEDAADSGPGGGGATAVTPGRRSLRSEEAGAGGPNDNEDPSSGALQSCPDA